MFSCCICNPETVKAKDTGIAEESNGISSTMGIMKMMGLRNSTKHDDRHKNLKVSSLVTLLSLCKFNFVSLFSTFLNQ